MRMKTLTVLLAAFGATSTHAQDTGRWKFVAIGSGDTITSIDTETISKEDGLTTVWVKYAYTGQYGKTVAGRNNVYNTVQREEYQCRLMRYAVTSYALFGKSGEPLGSGNYLTPMDVPIVPDTVTETIWKEVCR